MAFDGYPDIDIDDRGSAYVTGLTVSRDFPTTPSAFDRDFDGAFDTFVTKLSADGSRLEYSTYLPGSGNENTGGITVDQHGSAYVTGGTDSSDFATTTNAYDRTNSYVDVFVTKLNPSGRGVDYSTFIGGAGPEVGKDVAVDESGRAFIAGTTLFHPQWANEPYPTTPGAFDTALKTEGPRFNDDAFVTKLSRDGSSLLYSTFLRGTADDRDPHLAVDPSGVAYVAGATTSSDFPTTRDAYDPTYNGNTDLFLARLSRNGSELTYSTYLGGAGDDGVEFPLDPVGIAVDVRRDVYVGSRTNSADFPTTTGAFDRNLAQYGRDGFVTKLSLGGR